MGFETPRDDAERSIRLECYFGVSLFGTGQDTNLSRLDWETANTCLEKAAMLEPGSAEVFVPAPTSQERWAISTRQSSFMNRGSLWTLFVPILIGAGISPVHGRPIQGRPRPRWKKLSTMNPQAAFAHADLSRFCSPKESRSRRWPKSRRKQTTGRKLRTRQ